MDVKIIPPKDVFVQRVTDEQKAGNAIVSNKKKKNGSQVVTFQDGAKIMLHKSGHMMHKYADGSKLQYSPAGRYIKVY